MASCVEVLADAGIRFCAGCECSLPIGSSRTYCSRRCWRRAYMRQYRRRAYPVVTCPECEGEFVPINGRALYCCRPCAQRATQRRRRRALNARRRERYRTDRAYRAYRRSLAARSYRRGRPVTDQWIAERLAEARGR